VVSGKECSSGDWHLETSRRRKRSLDSSYAPIGLMCPPPTSPSAARLPQGELSWEVDMSVWVHRLPNHSSGSPTTHRDPRPLMGIPDRSWGSPTAHGDGDVDVAGQWQPTPTHNMHSHTLEVDANDARRSRLESGTRPIAELDSSAVRGMSAAHMSPAADVGLPLVERRA
jgi:hypothetical protein